jgi:thiamine biosynthesis protein ThiI
MKFIVKPHPEIFVKSDSVRKRFIKILESNLRIILKRQSESVSVYNRRFSLEVNEPDETKRDMVLAVLTQTPGIHHSLEVQQTEFTDLHNIFEKTLELVGDSLEGKTFCVRAKRVGKHDFTSIEAERYVGGGLNQAIETAKVKLKKPDITVNIEIENNLLNQVLFRHKGLGGFPLGTQEDVLSLISGGFDSGVSSYLHIKRGSKVHYCFFNLGGPVHEIGVKQVSHFLWKKYGSSAKVKFIAVDFDPVVGEILEKVDDGQMGVILKRMFMRAAGRVAEKFGIQALVTGEALGQVSSQTLTNLRHIDNVTDTLILRPLINWDKEDIIDFDFTILDRVIDEARVMDIREIEKQSQEQAPEIELVEQILEDAVVLDIRSPDEEDESPLELDGIEVKHIPFYKLATQFGDLPKDKTYLLYCAHGVMSRLQALYLKENGFENVKVYRPL